MKRKRTPKPLLNPLSLLMPVPASDRMRMALSVLGSLDAIAQGRSCGIAEWEAVIHAVNIVDTMAVNGLASVPDGLIARAEDAMDAAARRGRTAGRMGFSGPELEAVREVCGIYLWIVENTREVTILAAEKAFKDRKIKASQNGTLRTVEVA